MLTHLKVVAASVALAMLILSIWSCGLESWDGRQDQLAAGKAASARHAIHTEQLQAIMSRLDGSSAREWPQEMADLRSVQIKQERIREVRRLAGALAQAAKQIPGAVAGAALTEPQRAAFLAGVEELERRAAELEAAAAAHDLQRLQFALSKVKMNCYGCHGQFSEYAGPLRFDRPCP